MVADPNTAPWWAAGGAFALWGVREVWGVIKSQKKERTETDANVTLLGFLRDDDAAIYAHPERILT